MSKPENVLSVSALAEHLRELLEGEFPDVWVAGEVTNYRRAGSGHMYFTLKDANAQLDCAFFRGSNLRLRFDLKDGQHILAHGRINFYTARGETQLNVLEVQPKGIGAAELALRQLKEKLLSRGYFDPRRKRKLPTFPRRVAIVASTTGAALRDILELFSQRWPLTEVIVVDSRVQGDGAGRELALALRRVAAMHASGSCGIDAVVLGRGGGSAEDLAAFNEEPLADAIFRCPVPVVSAVGHETDISIADLVADHRAETPSAAVVALTPNRRQLAGEMLAVGERLGDAMTRRISHARQRLDQIGGRPVFRRPLERLRNQEQRLDEIAARLHRSAAAGHSRAADRIAGLAARLETLSPLHVLQRGYSLTVKAGSQKLIRDASEVQPGEEIVTRLAHGEIVSVISSITGAM